jgi:hypothetical protein
MVSPSCVVRLDLLGRSLRRVGIDHSADRATVHMRLLAAPNALDDARQPSILA